MKNNAIWKLKDAETYYELSFVIYALLEGSIKQRLEEISSTVTTKTVFSLNPASFLTEKKFWEKENLPLKFNKNN